MARPRSHDEAVRARLVEAAAEHIARGGPEGLSLRHTAQAAGTSTSAVYTLFGNRDGLVSAVREEAFTRFAQHLAAVERTADPGADLLGLGLAYRQFALAEPHFYRVMFDVAPRRLSVEEPTFGVLRDAVARLSPADPTAAALTLWALVHGFVGLELAGLAPGTSDDVAERFEAALRTCGPAVVGLRT